MSMFFVWKKSGPFGVILSCEKWSYDKELLSPNFKTAHHGVRILVKVKLTPEEEKTSVMELSKKYPAPKENKNGND